jgi:hypothetical protein
MVDMARFLAVAVWVRPVLGQRPVDLRDDRKPSPTRVETTSLGTRRSVIVSNRFRESADE